ncbi:hypothetical protein DQ04_07711010 [Trypanosoma grayi]|uniref:hypothetical protein n=1 Tax=Trypanosoma grayi TaxID=71804 RepID=UPI0004F41BE0|nr:hypothetical protein DQ04_07711010 [Trypanosoma grayi]KEG08215.1 hypothetical protein DQ04_07711010 [Trypanosoma grayi]
MVLVKSVATQRTTTRCVLRLVLLLLLLPPPPALLSPPLPVTTNSSSNLRFDVPFRSRSVDGTYMTPTCTGPFWGMITTSSTTTVEFRLLLMLLLLLLLLLPFVFSLVMSLLLLLPGRRRLSTPSQCRGLGSSSRTATSSRVRLHRLTSRSALVPRYTSPKSSAGSATLTRSVCDSAATTFTCTYSNSELRASRRLSHWRIARWCCMPATPPAPPAPLPAAAVVRTMRVKFIDAWPSSISVRPIFGSSNFSSSYTPSSTFFCGIVCVRSTNGSGSDEALVTAKSISCVLFGAIVACSSVLERVSIERNTLTLNGSVTVSERTTPSSGDPAIVPPPPPPATLLVVVLVVVLKGVEGTSVGLLLMRRSL